MSAVAEVPIHQYYCTENHAKHVVNSHFIFLTTVTFYFFRGRCIVFLAIFLDDS